ncbi:flippase [Pyrococcus abyssi]|uniref:Polysaccharide biosynthesis protein, putative n=1 Tax=Pyrococcus abyssi (strain GE5 / Orsay) TaxID=272844 RepID=Q9UZJ2_PYRAB|nr:flippase [Pyrococcus abyssi]CAB50065.1 Polysaccharide biosynthesis related protein, substrate unknown [Pyrococcus abyssi GE5]CCE70571.1 TPA: polysaccharide biosynthesis protein, putative [Pyrococcus abyssi GE5]
MEEGLKARLIKNAGWLFGAEVISKLLAYGVIVILSRTLGPEGLGQYSFIFYYIGLLGIFSDLGVGYYFMREVARDKGKAKELLPDVLGFKIVLALLNFLVVVTLTLFLPKPGWMKILIILAGAEGMLTWIAYLFVRIMYAHEVTKYEAIARVIERTWAFFVGGAVLYAYRSLTPFILVILLGYTLREILRIKWGSQFLNTVKIRFKPGVWVSLLKESYPFWLIGLFTLIYYRTDMVMLSLMRGDYETGIYRAAYTLIEVSLFVPNIVVSTTMPSMARLWVEDRKTLNLLFRKSFQMLLGIGILGVAGYYVLARLGITIVFGEKFLPSVPVLRILAFAIPFMFLNSLFGSFMNATGRELTFTKITSFTALLNVVLNYILIRYYGASGAAVATVVSQVFLLFLAITKSKDEFR